MKRPRIAAVKPARTELTLPWVVMEFDMQLPPRTVLAIACDEGFELCVARDDHRSLRIWSRPRPRLGRGAAT